MTMTPETGMRQAHMTAMGYFQECYNYLLKNHPDVSEEVRMQCAAKMALAASIDYATAQVSGKMGSPGLDIWVNGQMDMNS